MYVPLPAPSDKARRLYDELDDFMRTEVFPREPAYYAYREEHGPLDSTLPPVVEELKEKAKARGLWNLFLPHESGLSQLEYAPLAELTGWSRDLAPEALNCAAPDTGNMELLHLVGNDEQKERWLKPLLAGEIRSGFAMTEPAVASSDATNIEASIVRDGDEYVINGTKWFTSGASDPRCELFVVMGKTDPSAARHRQQSMVLVPRDTPGVKVGKQVSVLGHWDQNGHPYTHFDNVRIPVSNLLGEEGGGFANAQARLGPGRIHHVMRALGAGERAMQLMVERAKSRVAFGGPLADQGAIRERIGLLRAELEAVRALTYQACAIIDAEGNKEARHAIGAAKVLTPRIVLKVIDEAIQVFGGAGVTEETSLARMYSWQRALRIFDGPDEVHLRSLARNELRKEPRFELWG